MLERLSSNLEDNSSTDETVLGPDEAGKPRIKFDHDVEIDALIELCKKLQWCWILRSEQLA